MIIASKGKAVADAEADPAVDQSADLPKLAVSAQQAQVPHPAQPDGPSAAELAAEPAAEASLPMADTGDAAAQDGEAHALPSDPQAKEKKRKRQESDNPGSACEAEPAAACGAQAGSSKKKKKKKSSKVWPFSRVYCNIAVLLDVYIRQCELIYKLMCLRQLRTTSATKATQYYLL